MADGELVSVEHQVRVVTGGGEIIQTHTVDDRGEHLVTRWVYHSHG